MTDRTDAGMEEAGAPDAWQGGRLPVIPVGGTVIFPHVVVPLALTDDALVRAVQAALAGERLLVLLALRPGRLPKEDEGAAEGSPFHEVGTLGRVVHVLETPDGSMRALVQGLTRVDAREARREEGVWTVDASPRQDVAAEGPELERLRERVVAAFEELLALTPEAAEEARESLARVEDAAQLSDLAGANLSLPPEEKQALLAERDVARRLELALEGLVREKRLRRLGSELQEKVKGEVNRSQREFWLREQLRAIRDELGEGAEGDIAELRAKLDAAGLPQAARDHAERELRRLERTNPQAPDYHIVRSYLELLAEMPWSHEDRPEIEMDR
ncbi:MAG TPA: LON peptidase substrate-binding domain-containing protein, partial [Longimicrobiales bacterium]